MTGRYDTVDLPRPQPDRPAAAFDFDGTLTRADTLLPFLHWCLGARPLARATTAWSRAAMRQPTLDRGRLKESLVAEALDGITRQALTEAGSSFARRLFQRGAFRPELLDRVAWHQARGHRVIIVSASIDAYLGPVATELGVELACTRLAYDRHGTFSGRFATANCWGRSKVTRLMELGVDPRSLWAYGNSNGDAPMLNLARHPVRIGRSYGRRTRSAVPLRPVATGIPAL